MLKVGLVSMLRLGLLCIHIRSELSCKDALVAHKDSLRIFLFAFVAQVAHDVQFNFADAFKRSRMLLVQTAISKSELPYTLAILQRRFCLLEPSRTPLLT